VENEQGAQADGQGNSTKYFLMLQRALHQKTFLPLDRLTIRLSFQQVEGMSLGGSACWKVSSDCVLVRFAAQKGGKTQNKKQPDGCYLISSLCSKVFGIFRVVHS
jgi:hypothetical protein